MARRRKTARQGASRAAVISPPPPSREPSVRDGKTELLHGAALFLSAFLLFWIQPLLARMVLPSLGGVPAVWNTVVVFFQAVLLGGYLYAHIISRLRPSTQLAVHAALLVACAFLLPPRLGVLPPSLEAGGTATRLLLALVFAVGLPATVLSSTAPLLQGWYARAGRLGSEDPYFLYGASNAGSLAALLSFPALLEPLLPLGRQAWIWTGAFGALAVIVLLCGLAPMSATPRGADTPSPRPAGEPPPTAALQVRWLLLAFVPASLLLGVTTHLTTDIASVPLLWVLPLALYLFTYVMAFSRRTLLPWQGVLWTQAVAVVPLAVVLAFAIPKVEKSAALFPVHVAAFFFTALVCHRSLARLRPSTEHLTRFYLFLAVGGVLGGAFNVLVAPSVFRSLTEYPLVLIAACALRPSTGSRSPTGSGGGGVRRMGILDGILPILLFVVLSAAGFAARDGGGWRWALFGLGGVACLILSRRPVRFALALTALVAAGRLTHIPLGDVLAAERNFFGPVQVIGGGASRILYHGKTIHGAQVVDSRRRTPLAYYTTAGPLGDVFHHLGLRLGGAPVAVVGLGAGAIAAFGEEGQRMVFFEINPAVVRMATDGRLFTYLADSPAKVEVRLGDGRIGLAASPDGAYGLIIVDAFNSDAVPVHLLTREAVNLCFTKLAPGGVLVFNMTNDYLDLEAILGQVAADMGLAAMARLDEENIVATEEIPFKLPSDWMVMARSEGDLGGLVHAPGWRRPASAPGGRPWTDDYSSILAAFRRR